MQRQTGIIRYVPPHPRALTCYLFHLPSAHIVVYADASYAVNTDRSSQNVYTISIVDRDENFHLWAFCSKESARVIISVFSGESMALVLVFSHAHTL
jgi:site-specific DNA-adenine methylase